MYESYLRFVPDWSDSTYFSHQLDTKEIAIDEISISHLILITYNL